MSSTGNVFPTVGANVDRAGNTAWTSPENVVSDNTTDATVVVPSDYLVTSSYGFSSSVPINVAIRGVTVRVEASESGTGSSNYIPQLHSDTTPTLIGAAKGAVTVSGATKVISTSGGAGDLWGATITAAMVRSSGFGVSIWSTDTINTLAVDFITIAVEWTDVPNAWSDRQYFRKRRNATNRRLLNAPLNASTPATPPTSADRALGESFRTVTLRSRRSLSIGWCAELAAYAVAPEVPPLCAWLAPVAIRRRKTERRLIPADFTAIERYTPPSIAWSDPPNVIRVSFGRKIVPPAPQLVFPPSTGPPVEFYPAWGTGQIRKRSSHRRALTDSPQPDYPAIPASPAGLPAFETRLGFHKRNGTKRRLLTVELDSYPVAAAEASDDRALGVAFVTRKVRSRRLLVAPEVLFVAAAAPTAALYPSFVPGPTFRRKGWRKNLSDEPNPLYPVTPPASTPAVYPSFVPGPTHRRAGWRELRRVLHNPQYPATPSAQVTYAAVIAPKSKRRKPQARVLFGGVAAYEYAPQLAPYPSYVPSGFHKRRETERKLRKATSVPFYRPTVFSALYPSFVPVTNERRAGWRKNLSDKPNAAYPESVPQPPTPAVYPSFVLLKANRRHGWRKWQRDVQNPIYPQIPVAYAALVQVKANRRHGWKQLRKALHNPAYPATPIPAVYASLVLNLANRRHGWRKHQHEVPSPLYEAAEPIAGEEFTFRVRARNRRLRVGAAGRVLSIKSKDRKHDA